MKTKVRSLCLLLGLGLTASISTGTTLPELTPQDCKSIFPTANSSENVRALASGVRWTEAWERASWGPAEEFLGYVFLKSVQHEGSTIDVLVGMTNAGVITSVTVKGRSGVAAEFLGQFRGKTLRDNFDLVRTPEDLLFVPAKIKAMAGELALSEGIAQAVTAIAQSAREVIE